MAYNKHFRKRICCQFLHRLLGLMSGIVPVNPSTQWRRLEEGRNWPPRQAQLGWVSGKKTILSTWHQLPTRTLRVSSSTRLAAWSPVRLPLVGGASTASSRGSRSLALRLSCRCLGGSVARKQAGLTVAEVAGGSNGTSPIYVILITQNIINWGLKIKNW